MAFSRNRLTPRYSFLVIKFLGMLCFVFHGFLQGTVPCSSNSMILLLIMSYTFMIILLSLDAGIPLRRYPALMWCFGLVDGLVLRVGLMGWVLLYWFTSFHLEI